MTPLEKFRYLGAGQSVRKYALKLEHTIKRRLLRPPVLPPPGKFEGHVQLLGNHLVAEAAALSLYDGTPHPWLRQAAGEQFYSDGVHREQSVAYHHFVTHLFAIAGLPQPKALAYLGAIRQPDGSLPMVGDSD